MDAASSPVSSSVWFDQKEVKIIVGGAVVGAALVGAYILLTHKVSKSRHNGNTLQRSRVLEEPSPAAKPPSFQDLIQCLKKRDLREVQKALETLLGITRFADTHDTMRTLGGVTALLSLLLSHKDLPPNICILVLYILINLATNTKNRHLIARGIPSLIEILTSDVKEHPELIDELKISALQVLLNLTITSEYEETIGEQVMDVLIEFISSETSSEKRRLQAMRLMINLITTNQKNRGRAIEKGVPEEVGKRIVWYGRDESLDAKQRSEEEESVKRLLYLVKIFRNEKESFARVMNGSLGETHEDESEVQKLNEWRLRIENIKKKFQEKAIEEAVDEVR